MKHYSLKLVTAPASEPVTTAEAKLYARIDIDTEDAVIVSLIQAARKWCETYTRRAFINQTWRLSIDTFSPRLGLPNPPLSSVTSITYIAPGETSATTLATNQYVVHADAEPGVIVEAVDASWPSVRGEMGDVQITYVAGYGATADDVPEGIKTAIKMLVAHWYEHREVVAMGAAPQTIPLTVESLLIPFRWGSYA